MVRLLADDNSQREVARMLGVSQGCISKILRRIRETGQPHQRKRGGSMKISTPREDSQLLRMVRTNHFILAPRLGIQLICRFGRRMSVRTIGDGFWPQDIGLGGQPDVQASLWNTGDATVSGGGAKECGTMETLYLHWWVPVLPTPHWWSDPGAP